MKATSTLTVSAILTLELFGIARAAPADDEFFETKVRPILVEHCLKCHGEKTKQRGDLVLDSREGLLKGGASGAVVVPGKPDESLLIEAVRHANDDLKMPPSTKLTDGQIAALTRWVAIGAPYPESQRPAQAGLHWSFRPVQKPPILTVKRTDWPRSPIDAFILAKLEERGLTPAEAADRRIWLRRVTLDLAGLLPTAEETAAYLADRSPEADARVVDRLLASPRFGERFARHWMDLVRYAETRGHEFDYAIPNAYHYRDYLIRAINADVPYDHFVTEHVAGDLLEAPRHDPVTGANESITGTAFWFFNEELHSPVDIRGDETDRIDNKIDVFGKTFLGLTVACARCHDHKFDPIPASDYYALAGFVLSTSYRQARIDTMGKERSAAAAVARLDSDMQAAVGKEIAERLQSGIDDCVRNLAEAARMLRASDDKTLAVSAREGSEALIGSSRLRRWVAHLQRAKSDPRDPFHVFANTFGKSERRESDFERAVAEFAAEDKKEQVDFEAKLSRCRVIVDYGASKSDEWMCDGPYFGAGPVAVGQFQVEEQDGKTGLGVETQSAAIGERAWDRMAEPANNQGEVARLAGIIAPGKMLRTPTFTIESGKLYCLVRGAGHVYAAVDSHRANNGPLHAALVHSFDVGNEFRWVEHDLTTYKGHRAHIEFSPKHSNSAAGIAIAMVVESENDPPNPLPALNGLGCVLESTLKRLGSEKAGLVGGSAAEPVSANDSVAAAAEAMKLLLTEAVDRLERDAIRSQPDARLWAALADWLIRHRSLFEVDPKPLPIAESFRQRRQEIIDAVPATSRTVPAMMEANGVDEHVLLRGKWLNRGALAPRRLVSIAGGGSQAPIASGSGRLELARRTVAPSNPLTARVMANRIWHHLFGTGIVPTVDNFGALGQPPSHPELLDHLATRFVEDGWSVKRLVRSIVLSSTYRMSSKPNDGDQVDPNNRLLHRMPVRRLQAETIRDVLLAASGRLDLAMYGPGVPIHLTPFMEGRGRPDRSGPLDGAGRRSVYGEVRRNFLAPMMLAFDTPLPFATVGRRSVSNVPAQALTLLNDPFVVEQAAVWANRLLAGGSRAVDDRLDDIYETAFSRAPSPRELSFMKRLIATQGKSYGLTEEQAENDPRTWRDVCHAVFNAKEFIFVR